MLFLESIPSTTTTIKIKGIMYGRIKKIVYCLSDNKIKGMINPKNILVPVSRCKNEIIEKCENLGIKVSTTPKKMEVVLISNIEKYKKPFEKYPEELLTFVTKNDIKLPAITSSRGQALALMSQPEIRGRQYLTRNETDLFFQNIGVETSDSIQGFNKATGLKRIEKKGAYCLEYPFVCDKTDINKRKGVCINGDKDEAINSIKDWWNKNLVNVPNDKWQIGHLDPTVEDTTDNLAWQPPLQGKYRNSFKWDSNFHKMWPTSTELIPKFDKYYTEKEQRAIYEALKKKFETSS
jgi:hypothetical protein